MGRIIGFGSPVTQACGVYPWPYLFLGAPAAIAKPLLRYRDPTPNEASDRLPPIGPADMRREPPSSRFAL